MAFTEYAVCILIKLLLKSKNKQYCTIIVHSHLILQYCSKNKHELVMSMWEIE